MEGSLAADKMTFSALDAVNNVPILASSTAFYVLGLAALIQTVEHTGLAQILRNRPTLNNEYGEYLACVLNEVPIVTSVLNAWANLVNLSDNMSAQIVYNGWTGNAVRLIIVVTLSIIVVRALLLRLTQWSHQLSMAHALENGTVSPESVKKRLVRVPTTLNSHLMRSALTHPDTAVRRRALAAMARLEVPNFAREFLEKLGQHIERDLGLAHIRETLGVDECDGAREHGRRSDVGDREADAVHQGRDRHADQAAAGRAALDAEARLASNSEDDGADGQADGRHFLGCAARDEPCRYGAAPEGDLHRLGRQSRRVVRLLRLLGLRAVFRQVVLPLRKPDRAAAQRGGDLRRRLPDAARSAAGCSVTSPTATAGAWR